MNRRRRTLWLFVFLILATLSSSAATSEPVCPASMEEQRKMPRQITTEIEIAAPAEIVWKILLEFERYPEWNPFVKEISGDPTPDGRLTIVVQPPGGSAMTFKPRVLKAEAPRELRWLGKLFLPRIFDGEHSFVLDPLGENRVRLTHSECFRGLLVPMLWKGLDTDTRAGFEELNQALKARAEERFSAASGEDAGRQGIE